MVRGLMALNRGLDEHRERGEKSDLSNMSRGDEQRANYSGNW